MHKEIPSPDKLELEKWQANPTTMRVWRKLCSSFKPYKALRTCPLDKVEFHRGQAEILDELRKYFDADKENIDNG